MFSRGPRGHEIDDGTEEAGDLSESNISIYNIGLYKRTRLQTYSTAHNLLLPVWWVSGSDRDEKVII